ncbi:unnamed protein product, partial [marine sediment metagenome]
SLVNYLNGQISVRSSPKKGTSLTIQLPLVHNPSPEYIQNDVFIENNTSMSLENTIFHMDSDPVFKIESLEDGSFKEYELLIVEDNKELAAFLAHHFSRIFKISIAHNGEEALQKIKRSHPDLVISDIIMPRMDGFSLCNAIKDSLETCHIPIILLTAKSGEDSKIEGLYKGADAYISKPFNLRELDLHVRNILKLKENLRKQFIKFEFPDESLNQLCNKDQMFIENFTKIIHEHLDDGSFDVGKFCRKVNMSRTLLHMKLKKITG